MNVHRRSGATMRAGNTCHPSLELTRALCLMLENAATFAMRISETVEVRRLSTGPSESVLVFEDRQVQG